MYLSHKIVASKPFVRWQRETEKAIRRIVINETGAMHVLLLMETAIKLSMAECMIYAGLPQAPKAPKGKAKSTKGKR